MVIHYKMHVYGPIFAIYPFYLVDMYSSVFSSTMQTFGQVLTP